MNQHAGLFAELWIWWLCFGTAWTCIGFVYFMWYMKNVGLMSNNPVPLRIRIIGGPIVWCLRLYIMYRNRNIE